MIIAIDGPAASGKGTLARRLAAEYGLAHLDTGLLYRAVAKVLLDHAFGQLSLNRVCARYLKRNGASGRVLEKLGMQEEGCLRQENKKWDVFEDVVVCGILRSEWEALRDSAEGSSN